MKINTDGVLLGALAGFENPSSILDIGTGTGVIAMMLAQRFLRAQVDAIEIDLPAAQAAVKNFNNSAFSTRLKAYHCSFQEFSKQHPDIKYDLIVSNPPFFTHSLINPDRQKQLARHTTYLFFNQLLQFSQLHLTETGACFFILPLQAADFFVNEGQKLDLNLTQVINIRSSEQKHPHRQLIKLDFSKQDIQSKLFTIYEAEKSYTLEYRSLLKDFLTIF